MERCSDSGIDGVIVPDLPFEEMDELAEARAKYGIAQISMIAPTSRERAARIAKNAEGFLYCVSSLGVTGIRDEIGTDFTEIIRQAKQASRIPCAVGFGIATPEQARDMAAVADGVIIGSAIVSVVEKYGRDCEGPVREYVGRIKSAMQGL
jgi:tryptophan synthase alpha chain